MAYRHFGEFVDSLSQFDSRQAMVIKRSLRTERTTYHQLRENAAKTAHYLISRGIKPGDRVMVVAPNSPEWVELFLGAQLAGAILVPVDARNLMDTVKTFAGQTAPKIVSRSKYILPELDDHFETLVLDDLHEFIKDLSSKPPMREHDGKLPAVIVFTSGTTAAPKGVVLSQQAILSNVDGVQQMLRIDPEWRFLSVLPLSHMYELTAGCTAVLSGGASVHYLPRIAPLAIAKALREYQITSMLAVPQLLILFYQRIRQRAEAEGQLEKFDKALRIAPKLPFAIRRLLFHKVIKQLGGHLDFVATGGAPIPPEVARAWEAMGIKMVQGYGLTETAPILTMNTVNIRRLDSQGMVIPTTEVRIGEEGEIQAKGKNIFTEYWQNKHATHEAFTDDGWFKTGDVGRLDGGWLHIQGRAKFAIVLSSGLKVFPEDVEQAAEQEPALQKLCVVGINKPDGEQVHAVVASEAADTAVNKAVQRVNASLESFQHITDWSRWPGEDFPRTRLLKIDRKTVQAWANERASNPAAGLPHDTEPPADKLVEIIRLSLDNPRLKVKESDVLAHIGLDSLRRLTVVSLIEEQMSVSLPESQITQTTTVAQLRKLIKQGNAVETPQPRPSWPYNRFVHAIGNGIRNILLRGFVRLWVKSTVVGTENLDGLNTPAIFIFNHTDGFDGPVVYQSLPKHIRNNLAVAVADDIMRSWPIIPPVARLTFGGFNIARKEPFAPSLEYIGTLVDKGWNITLAPEGTVTKTGQMQQFKTGIGLLAVELGIPVVPMKVENLYGTVPMSKLWPQKHSDITVKIGRPIVFAKSEDYRKVTEELERIIRDM